MGGRAPGAPPSRSANGLPHSDQGKIPSDFPVLSTFSLFLVSKYKLYSAIPDSIGGSKGALGMYAPMGPISFIFMQFSAKIFQNNRFSAQS